MSNYAIVKNGVVENVVVWDGIGNIFDNYIVVNIENINAGIGWLYDGEAFTPPSELTPTPPGNQAS
ncbi:hypothetical protein AB06_2760 [Escherichia coli 2-474-04_S1_C1]|uniref:hypothetical protein n=1 Tax=Escherichia coli TaxID=562 RepID=UPI0004D5453D|nr:hypothetical protein [Escherichia coli]KDY79878.1 hypothetical protein AB06_2760 [Escherichia coli 2-474-04_S1_C1]